ncbi:uncharacterized protein LOC121987446 [Zingiber officinale]|uniref:Uncharacterized protein n=1 Tax=Zingiber officinale TaxID=94328 RepID=A0A8J5L0X7_ZINOF|nr:uncharacterized protein LOC121987446 [Zingiber officinale]KAG6503394.1 hypothetical protein ZIOFF_035707 [Zingiber officinale]
MENARDARRRRILERGSDRLALISGQVQSVPDSSPRGLNEGHPPPSGSPFSSVEGTSAHLTDQYKSNKDGQVTASEREEINKHKPIPTTQASIGMVSANKMEHNTTVFELKPQVNELQRNKVSELCNASVVAQNSSDQVLDTALSARLMKHVTISSKQVSHVVSASENARLLCAFAIAIFTVISSCLGGVFGGSINFRPLFLVILADLTIVFWPLMANQAAKNEKLEYHWTGNLSDILEAWLIFQEVAGTIFMDCSICAVVMISALCIQIF